MVNRYDLVTLSATGSNTTTDVYSTQPIFGYIEKIVLNTQSVVNGSVWVLASGTNELLFKKLSLVSGNITNTYYPRTMTCDTAGTITVGSIWTRPSVLGPVYIGGSALGPVGSVTASIYWSRP